MSVDALLVRLPGADLARFRADPDGFVEHVEALRFPDDGPPAAVVATRGPRHVYLDEWAATLVSPGWGEPDSPLARAVHVGTATEERLVYGHGPVLVHPAEVVVELAATLEASRPRRPLDRWVTGGELGLPTDLAGVETRAGELAGWVLDLYRAAAAAGEVVIVASV